MNELILDAALGLNGERVLVIVMDNGPLNRNKHVSGTFGQFLVDHGIVDHVVIIFYWQVHKEYALLVLTTEVVCSYINTTRVVHCVSQ